VDVDVDPRAPPPSPPAARPGASRRTGRASLRLALLALAAAFAIAPAAPPAAAQASRRFALVVGNDEGGPGTRPLLYAAEDARKIYAVLTELGGVRSGDLELVLNQSASDVLAALGRVEAAAAAAGRRGERTALFVYYSGHAKDGQLRLGGSRLDLRGLTERLKQATAHVTIAVFDSCQAGVVTRTKGARKGPAFAVEADGSHETRGLVLLTSSSADEDSQESDAIGGSYFSHHLISGLRGSADRSGDRRVTLSEAYAYAHARTIADTAETAAGAQHPTFAYDLKGNGDLVLTDLGHRREGIYVPPQAPPGTYYVVDAIRGMVVVEIEKPAGRERPIALAPGRYRIKRRLPDRLRVGDIDVPVGRWAFLDEARLRDAPFSDDPVKGVRRDLPSRYSLSVGGTYQSFFDRPTRESLFPAAGMLALELVVRDYFRRRWVWGIDVAAGNGEATLVAPRIDVTLPFKMTEIAAGASLFREWPVLDGRLVPFVGGRLALMVMSRTFAGAGQAVPDQSFATFSPGVLFGLRYELPWGLSLWARSRVHYVLYNVSETSRSLAYFELGSLLSYEF
jgi:uncharacterized caspase-like protein